MIFGLVPGITPKPETSAAFKQWASFWWSWAGMFFLAGYLPVAADSGFLPKTRRN